LNPVEPVEKPQAHRTGDVKNHFADFDLGIILRRFHVLSFRFSVLSVA
jgi:hypothetical protein